MNTKRKENRDIQSLDGTARREEIATLANVGSAADVEPLLGLCRAASRKERDQVRAALVQIVDADSSGKALRMLRAAVLTSESNRVRRCAIAALASLGQRARPVLPSLLTALADSEWAEPNRRAELAEAVGAIGGQEAAEILAGLLDDEQPIVQVAAVRVLGTLSSVQILRQAFSKPDAPSYLRMAILQSWQEAPDEAAVPLIAAAASESDPQVRRQAVRCLAAIDSAASTDALVSFCQTLGQGKRRDLALKGLQPRYVELLARIQEGQGQVVPVLLDVWRSLGSKRSRASKEIFAALVDMGATVAPALCATLDGSSPASDVIRVLEKMGSRHPLEASTELSRALLAELDNPDVATACAAARVLGMLDSEEAVLALAERLSFDSGLLKAKGRKAKNARRRALALQQAAAIGLGRMGRSALTVAIEAAHSADPTARRGGVIALGRIGGGRALSVLDRAVNDPEPLVREAAAAALGKVVAGDVRRLAAMLQNDDERIRAKAAKALGKLDDLRSLDLLLRAYGDPSDRVNHAVVKAMARREGVRAASMLIAAAGGGNVTALRALEKNPSVEAIPALFEALDSPWSQVYAAALRAIQAHAMAFREDPASMSALRAQAGEISSLLLDGSPKVRKLAVETLGMIGDPSCVQDMALLLIDPRPEIRRAALHVLELVGGEKVVQVVREYMEDEEHTKGEDLYGRIVEALRARSTGESVEA